MLYIKLVSDCLLVKSNSRKQVRLMWLPS